MLCSIRRRPLLGLFSALLRIFVTKTYGTLYPGGGIEGHIGPIGLRLDVGDEIYFNNGTHNNLRASFGPYIRF